MPTNEQRRATAKRKLERQLERRAQQARRRRIMTIAGAVLAVLVLAGAGGGAWWYTHRDSKPTKTATTPGVDCQYPAKVAAVGLDKPVNPPRSGQIPTEPAQISASMMTDQGPIGLMLDNAKAPCTVNSFASLAGQKFFDNTQCHRLTTSPGLKVLQCGDPKADGTGGPGYEFADEFPANQYPPGDPALDTPISYPRGTLAMANSGPNTNGSQFFLVYADSQLPPRYTQFGTIQPDGLATLDKIAAGGVEGGGEDGPPATKVTITSVLLD